MSKKLNGYITSYGYIEPTETSEPTEVYKLRESDFDNALTQLSITDLEKDIKHLENICNGLMRDCVDIHADLEKLQLSQSNTSESIQDLVSAIKLVNSDMQEKIQKIDNKLIDNISIIKSNQHAMQKTLRRILFVELDEQSHEITSLKSKYSIVYPVLMGYAIAIAGIIVYLMN